MGRKKKGATVDERVKKYLEDYELDDLNKANDLASLRQMCQLEISIEKIHASLDKITPHEDAKIHKDLMTSLKDAENAYTTLQTQLAIDRKKRASDSEESPLAYIERLKSISKQFMEKRLLKLICKNCTQLVMKYHIYIYQEGEEGALDRKKKPVRTLPYSIVIECPKCGEMVEKNEREDNP